MQELSLWIATQIITESFPISSSSHIKIVESILATFDRDAFLQKLPPHFDDLLHVPTLVILAIFFFHRWYPLLRHPLVHKHLLLHSVRNAAVASAITTLFYALFHHFEIISLFPLSIGLLVTASLLLSVRWCSTTYTPYSLPKACILGVVQGLALLPGISRLASTYVIARWLQLSPQHALETSFAIQAPLIIAAMARGILCAVNSVHLHQVLNATTGLVMIISSIVAYQGLMMVSALARSHRLWLFSYYMIIPLTVWLLL